MFTDKKGLVITKGNQWGRDAIKVCWFVFFFPQKNSFSQNVQAAKQDMNLGNYNKVLPNQDLSRFKITKLFSLGRTFKIIESNTY